MNIYLAYIEQGNFISKAEFYELVKANTKTEAYDKVIQRYPKANMIEVEEPIE